MDVRHADLEELGLTRNESKTYLALLELGLSRATPISRRSGLHSSKTYDAIDGLLAKGLVSYVVKDNRRVFRAEEPRALLEFLAEKKRNIETEEESARKIIGSLEGRRASTEEGDELFTYEGIGGLKSLYRRIYSSLLKKGDTHYILGAPRGANELIEDFLVEANRLRCRRGISLKIIYYPDAREFGVKRSRMPLTEVRYFRGKGLAAPTAFEVFGDHTSLYYISRSETRIYVIRNAEIARSMRNFFGVIWGSDFVEP
ncbi:MAG: helix-turn-helix domain-containing protein [Candidatus Micrarchaeota archaeon]